MKQKRHIALSSLPAALRATILKELKVLAAQQASPLNSCLQAVSKVEKLIEDNLRSYNGESTFAINMKIYALPINDYDLTPSELDNYLNAFASETFEQFTEGFAESWMNNPALTALREEVPSFSAQGRSDGWFTVDIDDLKSPFANLEDVRDLFEEDQAELTQEDLEEDYGLTKELLKSLEDYANALFKFLTNTQETVKSIVNSFPKDFDEYLQAVRED